MTVAPRGAIVKPSPARSHALSDLVIASVTKSYTAGTRVLDGIDLTIAAGAFFTLLGPSGCGKTTLLRCIAGFLQPDSGRIAIGADRIDTLPAHRRDIGMVFQDYAVFPHLTVAENVGFGLKARRMERGEIARRVQESLATVRLADYADRLPGALSGGQQQRVGLARAMAIRPRLLLMDEPLSNLDAKLRLELREDIRDIQQRLGITTIYVTHDQEEALAVSDRICVMHAGRIEQNATPFELYRAPATRFAATFVGEMNFFPAAPDFAPPGAAEVAIRPEDVVIGPHDAAIGLDGVVRKVTFLGREAQVLIATPLGNLLQRDSRPSAETLHSAGQPVRVSLPRARLAFFDAHGIRLP